MRSFGAMDESCEVTFPGEGDEKRDSRSRLPWSREWFALQAHSALRGSQTCPPALRHLVERQGHAALSRRLGGAGLVRCRYL
eukprot:766192-Hanusia_phi.AAC.4